MDLRPSPIVGRWYPSQPDALRASVDAYLAAAADPAGPPVASADVVGLLVPHAGHLYSGAVAAHGFRAVQGARPEVVALVCPSHYHADGPVLTSAHDAYVTPLGAIMVDQAAVARLRAELAAVLPQVPPERALVAIRDDQEHAIEIELPFLQRSLAPGFQLLPVMLRDQDPALARALGAALAAVLAGARRCWWPALTYRTFTRRRGRWRWTARCCGGWRPLTRPACWRRPPPAWARPAGRAR